MPWLIGHLVALLVMGLAVPVGLAKGIGEPFEEFLDYATRVTGTLMASVAVVEEAAVITSGKWLLRHPYGWPLAVWGS
ncbi:hypothetical protein ACIBG8_41260 [Nonomuraea sp. NPDC050556]|uniref:hypothetical protein n=1 Tax=Nonomuraea sp. NPDC050556 TaxID=3364369 RepID=UPI0037921D0A